MNTQDTRAKSAADNMRKLCAASNLPAQGTELLANLAAAHHNGDKDGLLAKHAKMRTADGAR